jgi:hypothetical protein
MPAKLPPELISHPPRHLRELQVGETGYVVFTALKLDAEGYCYLNPDAELRGRTINTIKVTRDPDGFHVTVPDNKFSWDLGSYAELRWYTVEHIELAR